MLQQAITNIVETNKNIESFGKKKKKSCEEEPDEKFRTEKYNNWNKTLGG